MGRAGKSLLCRCEAPLGTVIAGPSLCVGYRRRSVRPFVRPVVISKNTHAQLVVIDDRPVTPRPRDIDSSSASAQRTICLGWRVKGKVRLRAKFLSQWRYYC